MAKLKVKLNGLYDELKALNPSLFRDPDIKVLKGIDVSVNKKGDIDLVLSVKNDKEWIKIFKENEDAFKTAIKSGFIKLVLTGEVD